MAQAKTLTKIRKKKWYSLIAPRLFRNAVLGETCVYDENALVGKTVAENLMNLTGDFKKQNTNINFIVTKVEAGKALTEITGFYMIPTSLRRLTRRNSEKIELSFVCKTSDGVKIRIKPIIFAISSIRSSVGHNLRKTATEFVINTVSKLTFENLINDLINQKLQNSLRASIKKIYPVRVSQIKSMYIETDKKPDEETVAENEKSVKEPSKEVKEEKPVEKETVVEENKQEIKEEKTEVPAQITDDKIS